MPVNNILVVRTDRLGDVLLTTPLSTALKKQFPMAHITWLVKPYTAPLLDQNPDVDRVIIDRGQRMSDLIAELRAYSFDAAIVAYPRWRAAWSLWRAGIPQRIGPVSKWYSLFFNRRIYQHRSRGEKHEADYNLELLSPFGIAFKRYPTRFVLSPAEREKARKTLESFRITFKKPVVILHPGSGGSSARWPLSHFMQLGDRLQSFGCDVVVTSGPGEDYQYKMIDNMHRIPVFIAAGSVNLREFSAILSCGNLMVSNSTGPLHIAVALAVPTVSVYSALVTCHPKRWGPYPSYAEDSEEHSVAIAPQASEGSSEQEAMAQVSVDKVFEMCAQRLARTGLVTEPLKN